MRIYLHNKISLKELKEWNIIAEEGRYFINQKIIPVIHEIEGINKDCLINDISWNLLHFIIEEHYKKKKIIITETLNNPFADRPSSAATNISNLIASVNNKMEAEGYTIISSDVAFMEGYTDDVKLGEVITLIFERETKEQANN